jgi:hypothetical protein
MLSYDTNNFKIDVRFVSPLQQSYRVHNHPYTVASYSSFSSEFSLLRLIGKICINIYVIYQSLNVRQSLIHSPDLLFVRLWQFL